MAALADHLWQSTWCALAIWLWMRMWRGGFAATRHGLLLFASVKFLVPLALLYAIGGWLGFPVAYSKDPPPHIAIDAVRATQPLVFPAAYLPSDAGGARAGTWLAAAWAAVALQLAARRIRRWRAMRAAVRGAMPFPCECTLETRMSTVVAVPTVVGMFRPVLLLPVGIETALTAGQLAAVFAYAREYARRRFCAQAGLQSLVEVLFWFHPVAWWIGRELPTESQRACDESLIASGCDARGYASGLLAVARLRAMPDLAWIRRGVRIIEGTEPRPLGFPGAVVVTACAAFIGGQPVLAGAIHDRLRRLEVLAENAATLSKARIEMKPLAAGFGSRMRLSAHADGVLLHNINMKELVAISYGVTPYSVISSQMSTSSLADAWLYSPRYDVLVFGPVREPDRFDPYALREPITRMLVERFGFELYENGDCQAPCGRFK